MAGDQIGLTDRRVEPGQTQHRVVVERVHLARYCDVKFDQPISAQVFVCCIRSRNRAGDRSARYGGRYGVFNLCPFWVVQRERSRSDRRRRARFFYRYREILSLSALDH